MKVVNLVDTVCGKHMGSLIGDFVFCHDFVGKMFFGFCFTCTFGKHFFCKLGRSVIFCI